jgi:hypothetical protein
MVHSGIETHHAVSPGNVQHNLTDDSTCVKKGVTH